MKTMFGMHKVITNYKHLVRFHKRKNTKIFTMAKNIHVILLYKCVNNYCTRLCHFEDILHPFKNIYENIGYTCCECYWCGYTYTVNKFTTWYT
jgi:hypothetical protein